MDRLGSAQTNKNAEDAPEPPLNSMQLSRLHIGTREGERVCEFRRGSIYMRLISKVSIHKARSFLTPVTSCTDLS